ncbi:MAG: hypothetical protein A2660_01685 [Candidatus Doudnabacteria bacterium RIFCSPHIGHO2_01_FULL_45_18]|uniref:Putative pre-16S rRNA nuclease n=1 Tax=Candidatus Doudnabacteria bacterium RIFCSPHIGHO2_01_FULL_45_18 TaxID=1817823 RepID=A0A1F5NS13_9BACT|nr:MAG: hypothetical protein A2660_01685 [Candidatus Doudnabacteria bacterium RIFCSPHIGHO2_01_FULL_45_18]
MRILALDWGEVRIGAAVSDEDGRIAFPLDKIIPNKNAKSEIKELIDRLEIKKIIIGLPKTLKGAEAKSAQKLKKFVRSLEPVLSVPIDLVDERFTTVEASKKLRAQGMSEKQQRAIKDNIAAQIMLQQYLNHL